MSAYLCRIIVKFIRFVDTGCSTSILRDNIRARVNLRRISDKRINDF